MINDVLIKPPSFFFLLFFLIVFSSFSQESSMEFSVWDYAEIQSCWFTSRLSGIIFSVDQTLTQLTLVMVMLHPWVEFCYQAGSWNNVVFLLFFLQCLKTGGKWVPGGILGIKQKDGTVVKTSECVMTVQQSYWRNVSHVLFPVHYSAFGEMCKGCWQKKDYLVTKYLRFRNT